MTQRSSNPLTFELNVTPMLDVLLVLLIIFIAVSIRVVPIIEAALPVTCTGVCEGGPPIVLEVLPGPSYRINHTPVPASDLRARLSNIYGPRPEKIIQIAGYPGVRYDDVVHAMDIAKSAGVLVVGIAAKDSYLRP